MLDTGAIRFLGDMKLTIFTSLKFADGQADLIQQKALENWRHVFPGAKIVTYVGALIPFGEMLREVEKESDAEKIMYANGDILFADGANDVIRSIPTAQDFLLTGQRIDILQSGIKRLHWPSGMDYFVFRRGMFKDMPKVWMGRSYCDSAIVTYCLRNKICVIDASFALRVEHQFHDYGHVAGGRNQVWQGHEAMENRHGSALRDFAPHCIDATKTLLKDGSIVPNIRSSVLRKLELSLYYRCGFKLCPHFNMFWNILTRGGKYAKNPRWDGVLDI